VKEVKLLICGAGYTAPGLLSLLGKKSEAYDFRCTLIDSNEQKLRERKSFFPSIEIQVVDVQDTQAISKLIQEHQIVVSLLPPYLHKLIANICIESRKHLITSSYLTPEVLELDEKAKSNGVSIIMEAGLDPGFDAILLNKTLKELKGQNAKVKSIKSYVGSVFLSDEKNFPYRITWNPQNIIEAGKTGAKFLKNKEIIELPYQDVFYGIDNVEFEEIGNFQVYPNRDSVSETNNDIHLHTYIRGTIRAKSFLELWKKFIQLGYTSDELIEKETFSANYNDVFLKCSEIQKEQLKSLEMFSEEKIPMSLKTQADLLKYLMEKYSEKVNSQEYVLLHQEIEYSIDDNLGVSRIQISKKGDNKSYSMMSFWVGGVLFSVLNSVLENKSDTSGVYKYINFPHNPHLYSDLLKELNLSEKILCK